MNPFGQELLVDAYDCLSLTVDDLEQCYEFLEKAVEILGVSKQAPPFIFHSPTEGFEDKAGISGWIPLIESGIQIHTLTAKNFVSVDYYTCSRIDSEVEKKLLDHIRLYFHPKEIESQLIARGVKYYGS